MEMNKKEMTEFFNGYYNSYIVDCSDIMFRHLNEALKEINDKHGLMDLTECYRAMAYTSLKILHSGFDRKMTDEETMDGNKIALSLVEKMIDKYREKENGKEIVYSLPLIMMDVLAFKEYEYKKAEELEEDEKDDSK